MDNRQTQIANHIRINTAFEQMIVSVLLGASFCGAAFFILNVATAIFGGYVWFEYVVGQLANAVLYAFVIFLAGFLAAAILITPIFVALEKIPYRRTWPFIVAALIIEFVLYFLFFKDFAGAAAPVYYNLPMFAPGVVITLIFGRRMQPYWRAVSLAEADAVDTPRLLH